MKFCNNCGEKLKEGEIYCPNCGKNQSERIIIKTDKEGLGTASMIIGIISLVFAFIINLAIIPIAVIGLILGIVNKAQKGKKISGIILNIVAIAASIIVFIVLMVLLIIGISEIGYDEYNERIPNIEKEEVLGNWNCKSVEKILKDDYELTVTLNNDKTFTIKEYNKDNYYLKGVYYFEDDDLNGFIETNKFHAISLNPLERYENGDLIKNNDNHDSDYQMIIAKTKDKYHTILTSDESDKVYYCNK